MLKYPLNWAVVLYDTEPVFRMTAYLMATCERDFNFCAVLSAKFVIPLNVAWRFCVE